MRARAQRHEAFAGHLLHLGTGRQLAERLSSSLSSGSRLLEPSRSGICAGSTRRTWSAWLSLLLVVLPASVAACSSGPAGRASSASPRATPEAKQEPAPAAGARETLAPPPAERQPVEAVTPQPGETVLFPEAEFRPAAIEPPYERSRQPGDGQWRPLDTTSSDRLNAKPACMASTVIHPHKVSRWAKLTLVAIDQKCLAIGYVPGKSDVNDLEALGGTKPNGPRQPGLVPEAQLGSLVAVFNGGFKPRHGRWGMRVDGETILPAREQGCTISIDEHAIARVAPWSKLEPSLADVRAFRQTPPCLVADGELHPLLLQHNERPWGGFDPKRKTRRRSAIGIDRTGRVLLYGIGEEMDPRLLAEGMRFAGARFAAQLDINWSWTRFLLFGSGAEAVGERQLEVTSTLIPKMAHQRLEYVKRPSARDFFYLRWRSQSAVEEGK